MHKADAFQEENFSLCCTLRFLTKREVTDVSFNNPSGPPKKADGQFARILSIRNELT